MPWNLFVQPYIRMFHNGLELLHHCAWKLSSNLSKRQAFLSWLQMLHHQTIGSPQHTFIREVIQVPSLVMWRKLCSMQGHLQLLAEFFLYLRRELKISFLAN